MFMHLVQCMRTDINQGDSADKISGVSDSGCIQPILGKKLQNPKELRLKGSILLHKSLETYKMWKTFSILFIYIDKSESQDWTKKIYIVEHFLLFIVSCQDFYLVLSPFKCYP